MLQNHLVAQVLQDLLQRTWQEAVQLLQSPSVKGAIAAVGGGAVAWYLRTHESRSRRLRERVALVRLTVAELRHIGRQLPQPEGPLSLSSPRSSYAHLPMPALDALLAMAEVLAELQRFDSRRRDPAYAAQARERRGELSRQAAELMRRFADEMVEAEKKVLGKRYDELKAEAQRIAEPEPVLPQNASRTTAPTPEKR